LLLLKQSIGRPHRDSWLLRTKGTLVDLGNFREFVFNNDAGLDCEIALVVRDVINNYDNMASDWALGVAGDRSGSTGIGVQLGTVGDYFEAVWLESRLYVHDLSEPIASFVTSLESLAEAGALVTQEDATHRDFQLAEGLLKVVTFRLNAQHEWWSRAYENFDSFQRTRISELLYDKDALTDELRNHRQNEDHPIRELIEEFERTAGLSKDEFMLYYQHLADDERASRELFLLNGPPWWSKSEHFHAWPGNQSELTERDVRTRAFRFLADLDRAILFEGLPSVAQETSKQVRDMLDGLRYLGPLRTFPLRHYEVGGSAGSGVGVEGQFAPDLLYSRAALRQSVNETLARFQIPYEIEVQDLTDNNNALTGLYVLRLRHSRSGVASSLRDVGFGVSQVLPVIVESHLIQASDWDEMLLLEQPELHLHPRLQAELADLFIQVACGDSPRLNQFIIETHSEHLLLRIMRRLRDTARGTLPDDVPEISPGDISIIYVHPLEDGSGSVPLVIDLDEDGELMTAWPNGFFEEGFRERFA
jgi:hypothetical protein